MWRSHISSHVQHVCPKSFDTPADRCLCVGRRPPAHRREAARNYVLVVLQLRPNKCGDELTGGDGLTALFIMLQ